MSQAPRLHERPRAAKTFGDLAGDFAADYGLAPDPWQQIVLDDWLAEKSGRWASLTCGLSVPRQNGKNALIEVRELFGMVGRGEKFLHTAHEVKTARKAFKRLQHFFGTKPDDPGAKFPELNALVTEVRNVNGQEAIFLKNGGSVEIVARSKNSARGFTVDVLVMDEAQEMSEDDLEALMPTTSSAPLGNPQWIFTGTPPGPNANGEIFTRVRSEAVSGKGVRLCWHEWSAEPGIDLDDRDEWRRVNPALINGRLQFEVIEGERARFSDSGFARERLGIWDEDEAGDFFDTPGAWAAGFDEGSGIDSRLALAVAVSLDRKRASIGAAGLNLAGRTHLEPIETHSLRGQWDKDEGEGLRGYEGLVAALKRLQEVHDAAAVAVDGGGPAKDALVPLLEAADIPGLVVMDLEDVKTASGEMFELVEDGEHAHLNDPDLNNSVRGAVQRVIGDRFAIGRRKSGDVVCFEAATFAAWASRRANDYDPLDSVL